ncbi:NADPH:adrenodoxin oxidoreductase, mitochondrial [Gossypium australe]|uniref:NADPH:adrenodoxin oxidoreductase, mitochondrial n=1 Tax=Gossypium australe TaxID=47621 RepID=A0A5B6UJ13_9ROSI|nr:NADPH:adrenodoxin oxidoreductase, mitochondrial [Gossypium australe]
MEIRDLKGVHSAREFVWWYNGHPDGRNLDPDLKNTDTAVILGQGNVALDVARILLRPTSELAITDIASHALTALEQSSIRKVYLVGRRGPVQAACTAKELREVLGIKDLYIHIKETDLKITPADELLIHSIYVFAIYMLSFFMKEEMKNSRIHRRIYELLSKAATAGPSQPSSGQRELHFVFFRQPDRFLESYDKKGYVSGVHLEKTALKGIGSGNQIAIGTGQFENLSCGCSFCFGNLMLTMLWNCTVMCASCRIVLKSIGYKSVPVDDLPFDNQKGVVPNVKGRVLSDNSGDPTSIENGLYVCGWLKRGPTGIIATNLYCAEETVASLSEDLELGVLASTTRLLKLGRDGLLQILDNRNVRVVPFSAWERIDKEEKRLGSLRNKPREKLTSWEELLKVAGSE